MSLGNDGVELSDEELSCSIAKTLPWLNLKIGLRFEYSPPPDRKIFRYNSAAMVRELAQLHLAALEIMKNGYRNTPPT